MPGARLELAQGFNSPTDFKSVASADSAIRARKTMQNVRTKIQKKLFKDKTK